MPKPQQPLRESAIRELTTLLLAPVNEGKTKPDFQAAANLRPRPSVKGKATPKRSPQAGS